MRTTVDIPDALYRSLKMKAAAEGSTVKQMLLRGAEEVLRQSAPKKVPRLSEPLIKGEPGTLHITNEMIHDLLDFS